LTSGRQAHFVDRAQGDGDVASGRTAAAQLVFAGEFEDGSLSRLQENAGVIVSTLVASASIDEPGNQVNTVFIAIARGALGDAHFCLAVKTGKVARVSRVVAGVDNLRIPVV